MGQNRNKLGILMLADIVNYTPQAVQAGTEAARKFLKEFQRKIKETAKTKGVEVIETSMGDCALMFISIDKKELLIDFVLELREQSRQGFFDGFGIKAALRFVAHFGEFEIGMLGKRMETLNSPDGIKVFRMEKNAKRYDVLITNYILNILKKEKFAEKGIGLIPSGENYLKGFEADELKTDIFTLVFSDKTSDENEPHTGLKQKTAELERDCQWIYVLGDLYDRIPMEKNFINLEIKSGFLQKETLSVRESFQRDDEVYLTKESQIPFFKANELYEKSSHGIIFGLPGGGKTTILRYFTFREFRVNQETIFGKEKANPRAVMFINCREMLSYRKWYRTNPAYQNCTVQFDIHSLLEYLTYSFLFRHELPTRITGKDLEILQYAVRQVVKSYSESCLTVLIDALDEAANREIKDDIETVVTTLYQDIWRSKRKGCRLYLSSRYSEKEAYFHKTNIPVFEVCSLKMEHLREMAGWFYGEETPIYRQFDEAVWKEEIAAKIGGTPLTALLVLAYFQVFQKFDTRYVMYDILIKFMLMRIWQSLKDKTYQFNNIESFFSKAKSAEILSDYPEIRKIYDAVTFLSWSYAPQGKIMKESDILLIFKLFTKETTEQNATEKSKIWMERLKQDHLFIRAGHDEYIFIHSTFMEFLGSRFIAEKRNHSDYLREIKNIELEKTLKTMKMDFFKTEVVPIAAGSAFDTSFYLLGVLKELYQNETDSEKQTVLSIAGFKSLAELENMIQREEDGTHLDFVKEQIQTRIEAEKQTFGWVYDMLKSLVLTPEQSKIQNTLERFNNISRLSRTVFLETYLPYESLMNTDSTLLALRKSLLLQTVKENLVSGWLTKTERRQSLEKLTNAGVDVINFLQCGFLQIDSKTYHSDDKNFSYYQQCVGKELIGFFGSPNFKHSSSVNSVKMSSDGKMIVSGSNDKTIKLWDISTGKEIRTFTGHQNSVRCVSLSADCKSLVSGSDDKTIKLWDLSTGKEIRTFAGHQDSVTSVSLSTDSKMMGSASSDNTIKLWDVATGKEIRTFTGHQNWVMSVSLSSDGQRLISGSSDNTVKLWDVALGKEIMTFMGHRSTVWCGSLSEDGKTMVSGSYDKTVKLWNVDSGKEIQTFSGHLDSIMSVSLSADGKTIASGSYDKTVKLWNVDTGKLLQTFLGHKSSVWSVSLSEDGKTIVSGSEDNTIKLWDVTSGKEIRMFTGHHNWVMSVSLPDDGTTLVSGSEDKTFGLWDVVSGKEIWMFTGHNSPVMGVSLSADGKTIVSGSHDDTVKLWDTASAKEIRTFRGHLYSVMCVDQSSDGKILVSGSSDNTVKLWNINLGKAVLTFKGHHDSVRSVSLSENRRTIVSGSDDHTVRLWDVSTGTVIRIFTGHQDSVMSVSLSEDGKTLVSGSADNTVRLWDISTGKQIRMFTGHHSSVMSVSLSRDGKTLFSCSNDMTVRLWDVSTGECLKTITLLWIPTDVKIFKTNPNRFVVAGANGTVALFDLEAE